MTEEKFSSEVYFQDFALEFQNPSKYNISFQILIRFQNRKMAAL